MNNQLARQEKRGDKARAGWLEGGDGRESNDQENHTSNDIILG